MSFPTLLLEMQAHQAQELAKAQALPDDPDGDEDDEDIQAAAAQANADNAEQELDGDAAGLDGDEGEEGSTVVAGALTKSFRFSLDDGQEVEAFDATDLVKSLQSDLSSLRGESLGVMTQAFELIKAQTAEIAALKRQVTDLGAAGRGRRSVLTVTEKSATVELAKAQTPGEAGLTKGEFFAKAASAQRSGRLSAQDISLAEAYSSKGMPIPERIVARVMGE